MAAEACRVLLYHSGETRLHSRVNSTEHESHQNRSLIHVSKTKEIAHLGVSVRGNKGIGGSGRTELDRVEAPRGEEIPRHSPGAPKNTTRDASREFVILSPHNQNFTALAVCILHCRWGSRTISDFLDSSHCVQRVRRRVKKHEGVTAYKLHRTRRRQPTIRVRRSRPRPTALVHILTP